MAQAPPLSAYNRQSIRRLFSYRIIFSIIFFAFLSRSTGPSAKEGYTYILKLFPVVSLISQWSQHPKRAIKTRQNNPIFSCYALNFPAGHIPPHKRHHPPYR